MKFCRMTEIKIAQGAKQTGGKLTGTVGAAGVTGLVPTEVLYGASDGTIEQEAAFTYDENDNIATVIGTNVSDIGYRVGKIAINNWVLNSGRMR